MNPTHPDKIVVLGFLSHFPVAGVAWQTLHYLVGLQRLGYDAYYIEAHGCTPSKLMQSEFDDGAVRAAEYIASIMEQFGFGQRWAYHAPYPSSRYFGMSETQVQSLYRSSALLLNLHGSHLPVPELTATNRLVYLGTDPVDVEVEVHNKNPETLAYLAPHCAFFTFGENLGKPDCRVPAPVPFTFKPTRQPVVLDFWSMASCNNPTTFTTIGNWRQPWREIKLDGQTYHWSKHFEFRQFIDLPRRVPHQPFELALSSYHAEDQHLLESNGWRVRPAIDLSRDLDVYRTYITQSRGEFTVAKGQNIRLRSGWFSDRAATYLAAGRPVITQDTGFTGVLPHGQGLFSFSKMEDILAAVEEINSNYRRQSRAALSIAREHFSYEVVLSKMLDELGLGHSAPSIGANRIQTSLSEAQAEPTTRPATSSSRDLEMFELPAGGGVEMAPIGVTTICDPLLQQSLKKGNGAAASSIFTLLPDLVIRPVSRWPTRLPEETIQAASLLPPPTIAYPTAVSGRKASIIIVTYQGLPFTKMCLSSLFSNGWNSNDELIIVDNASPDGTRDYLRELTRRNPFVRVVFNSHNRGFGPANNQAMELATGEVFILLNNDTVVSSGWRDGLLRWLDDADVGMVGPVTNRTCNEAQIDAPYKTYGELTHFATRRAQKQSGIASEIPMLALFCAAMRRDVFAKVGPLDEQFEIGMFEDDDYALRLRAAGYRIVCAEDVFVHHFGQASLGELCTNGDYDRILEANRARFEAKWGRKWQPHGRRITTEYQELRERIRQSAAAHLPRGATVMVVSKGDEELLKLGESSGWHFPQMEDGQYANLYPADSASAIAHLETLRTDGANYLLIPKPALWWLEHYAAFREHLDFRYRPVLVDEQTCLIFDLGECNA